MPLTSPSRAREGGACEVCGGQGCTKFTTHDWPGTEPFRPGTTEQMMTEQAETAQEETEAPKRPRGSRARRPAEDRAHRPEEGEDR